MGKGPYRGLCKMASGVSLGVLVVASLALPSTAMASGPPVSTSPQSVPSSLDRVFASDNPNLGLDGVDDKRVNVDIAVLDTGINLEDPDLNVVERTDCTGASWPWPGGAASECTSASPTDGADDADGLWHGTGVARAIAALDNDIGTVGAAAGARLWAVDIQEDLDPEGPAFDLESAIAGVKWVTAHADQIEVAYLTFACAPGQVAVGPHYRCVGSLDLVAELEDAIEESIAAGVVYVAPAGNANLSADDLIPQRFDDMLIVSAMVDSDGEPGGSSPATCGADDDTSSGISNWGSVVDITAPGCATSEAAPHVAAAAAILASNGSPQDVGGVRAIHAQIVGAGNDDWTDTSPDSEPEPLLDLGSTPTTRALFAPDAAECGDGRPGVDFDVDGDGRADLVAARPNGTISVYRGQAGHRFGAPAVSLDGAGGSGTFQSAEFIGEGHHIVDAADVTGDGCADLVSLHSSGTAYVHPGGPDVTFAAGVSSFGGGMAPAVLAPGGHEPVAVADVDGDGRADLVTYRDGADDVRVYRGQANGELAAGITAVADADSALHTGTGEYWLDVTDVTGDGKADLVSMTTGDDVLIRLGQGNGTFGTAIDSGLPPIDPAMDDGQGFEPVGIGDVTGPDGDGKRRADLVLLDGGSLHVYKGQSNGQFAAPATSLDGLMSTTFGGHGFEMAGLIDVNGDGHADIPGLTNGSVNVAKGQANGLWTQATVNFDGGFSSTQHFSNQNAAGNELVTEKPLYRRRGCAPNGCQPTTGPSLGTPLGVSTNAGAIDLFGLYATGLVWQRWWSSPTGWSGYATYDPPSVGAASKPTAVWRTAEEFTMFVRGNDHAIWQKTWSNGAGWSGWTSIGGWLTSAPAVVAPDESSLHVYSESDGDVWRRRWSESSGWAAWEAVPSTTGTSVGAVARGGAVVALMSNANGNITQRIWSSAGWDSSLDSHGAPPGGATSTPSAVWSSAERAHVFVRGADHAVWEKFWTPSTGWSAWNSLGGVLSSAPAAVSPSDGTVDVFAGAANDSRFRKRWSQANDWSSWEPVP